MDTDPRAQALTALAGFVVSDASLADTLASVAAITTDALPHVRFAGMTLLDERGRPTTAVFTSPESPEIDAAQYETGEGPCLDAWRQATAVRIRDTGRPPAAYLAFCRAAHAHGIGSTLSLPLVAAGQSLGALNLYGERVDGFSADDEGLATELASVAAVLLANSQAYWGAFELSQQLNAALDSRAVIDQAKGVLMARTPGLDADGAFEMLKHASQRENTKLRDVAARIVEHLHP